MNLTGTLDLSDFVSLEELDCRFNEITALSLDNCLKLKQLWCESNQLINLNLSNCSNLEWICCNDNHLQDLKFPSSAKHLTWLDISDNNFPEQDLSLFGEMINLETLKIDSWKKTDQGIYNRFYGSLEPLQNLIGLKNLDINNTNIDSGLEHLPENVYNFSCSAYQRKDAKCKAIHDVLYSLFANNKWEKIWNFPQKLQVYKQWRKLNFSEEEIKEWITNGAVFEDYRFVDWLKDVKEYGPEWVANYKEDYKVLSERFKKYGLCSECNQPNTGEQWCWPCNAQRLEKNFSNWTSGNPQVDEFIQQHQLQASDVDKLIEWIPYEQFTDIKYLAEGGFGKVYKTKWTEGNIHHWNKENNQWCRKKDSNQNYKEVVLKSLYNSQDATNFLEEIAKHKDIDDWFNNIVSCYGLSQDPETKNYLMVMQFMPEGNLRHYLSNKMNRKLKLKDKFNQLVNISRGLKDIHQKNLVHRDLHVGNILKGIKQADCLITDLGLCKPANEVNQEDKIFGVMPYVAPEVLQNQSYTQAADIYSFGIIAYEVLSGLPPYYDKAHDVYLGLDICNGLRPKFNIQIPPLLENLIKRCWDTNPVKRPTANELERTLRNWKKENRHGEFRKQLQAAKEYNQTLPEEIRSPKYEIHTGTSYCSKLLPTKEITQLLQKLKTGEEYHTKALEELTLDNFNLGELNIQEENQQTEQQAFQIQPPYGTPGSSK